ncbi:MAG: phosphopantothenate--cysteine ligase, partial [Lentisphaerae bacterium]|nr:phosphopantothenate--cysteine ligase [Lentisphaerota bacterium]
MNVLITAGGTAEKIDDVRKISNIATGRLGSLIADAFLKMEDVTVTYVCSEEAYVPQNKGSEVRYIDNVE